MFSQARVSKVIGVFSYVFLILNIVLVPLFLDKNLNNFYIIPKQYAFGGLVMINILLWIAKFVLTKKIQFTKTMIDVPILSLGIVGLLAAIFSANVYDSFFGRAEYFTLNFVLLILFFAFYYVVVNFVKTEKMWRGILDSFLAVGLITLILFILKIAFKVTFLTKFIGQSWNTIDPTNSIFGVWAVILLILSFGQLIKKNLSLIRMIWSFVIGILSFAVLVMLSFKILWIILLIALILLLMFGIGFIREVRLWWISVLFALLVFTIIFIVFGTPKFVQMPAPTELSLGFNPSWSVTYDTIFSSVKDFFIGSGLGSFGVDFSQFRNISFNSDPTAWSLRFNQPYDTLLSILSEGGVLFVCAFVFLILLVLGHVFAAWNKIRTSVSSELNLKKDNILFESFLVTIAFVVLTIGFGVVFYSQVLWFVWWLMLSLLVVGFSFYSRNFIHEKEWTLEDTPQYSLSFSFGLIVIITGLVMVSVWGARLYLGEIAFAKAVSSGDSKTAEIFINDALDKRPNSDVYHSVRAQIYLNQAVEISKQANPDVQAISTIMAKAVNEAKYATDLSPRSVALWENLATMYENASALVPEARDWALKSLQQARDLEPTNPMLWLRLGNNYAATAKWDDAIKNYEKAIALKADYFGAYVGLSNAYEQTQKMDKAIEVYEKIVGQNQSDPETLYNYGRLLYNRNNTGDRDLVEKIWSKVISIQPNYSNALYSLGLLYETRGDQATALQYYYRVKDLNPDNQNILDKIKKMVGASASVAPTPNVTPVQIKNKT
ncbi:MAG: tetratricopeptide repeat protein [Candidatus Magasanikbacteria bacterium]